MSLTPEQVENYAIEHSVAEDEYLHQLWRKANIELLQPRMISGHLQATLIGMFGKMLGAQKVLEIGTYSSYTTIAIAMAIKGQQGQVISIEANDEHKPFIEQAINGSTVRDNISIIYGKALDVLPGLMPQHQFDLVFIDANKREYWQYYEQIIDHLPSGAIILADNTLWDGKVLQEPTPTDEQTVSIINFNKQVNKDERVTTLLIPLRDGLTLIRKK